MAFHLFPYTNLHDLNLDWIIAKVKEASESAEESAETVAEYENRLSGCEDDIETLQTTVTGHGTRLTAAENDIDTLDNDLTSVKARTALLETIVDAHGNRLTAAEGDIDDLETDVALLNQGLGQADADIADHETRITALESGAPAVTVKQFFISQATSGAVLGGATIIVWSNNVVEYRGRLPLPFGTATWSQSGPSEWQLLSPEYGRLVSLIESGVSSPGNSFSFPSGIDYHYGQNCTIISESPSFTGAGGYGSLHLEQFSNAPGWQVYPTLCAITDSTSHSWDEDTVAYLAPDIKVHLLFYPT